MIQQPFVEKRSLYLITIGLLLYAVHIALAAYSYRVFYPDGTIYVSNMLQTGQTIGWHWHRFFAYTIQHFPITTAVNAGITDLEFIYRLHSGWYHSFAAIALVICYFATKGDQRKYMLFPLIAVFGIYINTEFFPITPGRFLVAIYWSLIFLTLFTRNIYGVVFIILLAIPTLRSYQGMLILGPMMAFLAYWRSSKEVGFRKWIFVALTLWFLGGVVVAIISILNPPDKASFITFLLGIFLFLDEELYPHFPLLLSMGLLIAFVRSIFWTTNDEKKIRRFNLMFLVGAILVGLMPLIFPESLAPETHQQVRSLNIYFNLALGIVLFLVFVEKISIKKEVYARFFYLIGILMIAQTSWNIQASVHWMKYLDLLRTELTTQRSGLVLYQDTNLYNLKDKHGLSNGLHNDWAIGLLSILCSEDKNIKTIIAHSYDNVFRPFDPRNIEQLPDLERYGVNYDAYLKGLKEQGPVVIPDRELPDFFKWFETDSVGVNDVKKNIQ